MRPSSRPARALALAAAAAAVGVAAAAEAPLRPGLSLDGMSYALSRGGANEMVVEADRARVSESDGSVVLEGVRARLGSFAGGARTGGGLELRCENGVLDPQVREFRASGRVEGRTGDGREFRTARLHYRHDQGLVAADAPVWIRDGDGTYHGGGFRYWIRQNRFRLVGGASIVQGVP